MRSDMAKVIVERPRVGSRLRGNHRKGRKQELEVLPRREGIKRLWQGGSKHFNEHLGPLVRYLQGQVGRPWDKVFSEICANINRNSVVQDHVRDHVDDMVVREVQLLDGVPCRLDGRKLVAGHHHARFYVCPRTNLLRYVSNGESKYDRRERRKHARENASANRYNLNKSLQCRRTPDGLVLVTLKPFPERTQGSTERDVFLDRSLANFSAYEASEVYGAPVYASEVRRLTRRELRDLPIPLDFWKNVAQSP